MTDEPALSGCTTSPRTVKEMIDCMGSARRRNSGSTQRRSAAIVRMPVEQLFRQFGRRNIAKKNSEQRCDKDRRERFES